MISALMVLTAATATPAQRGDSVLLHALPHAVTFVLERIQSEDGVSASGPIYFSPSRAGEAARSGLDRPIDSAAVARALDRPYREERITAGIKCSPKPDERGETTNCRMLDQGIGLVLRSVSLTDSTLTLVIDGLVTREFASDSSEVLSLRYELEYRERPDGDVARVHWREVVRGHVTARAVPVRVRRR